MKHLFEAVTLFGLHASTAFAVGTSGSHVSANNGDTWKLLDREDYNSVAFAPAGEGWAVGPKGRVAKFTK